MKCNCQEREGQNCIELVPIFSNLTKEEMFEIAMITLEKHVEKGEAIYTAGDRHDSLYVIHKGKVKITRISESGKEQILRVLGPGEFMGELTLFSKELTKDNAFAMENTIMCRIDGQDLKGLMSTYPSIAMKILEELSQRLEKAETLVEDISLSSVERRIAKSILSLEDKGIVKLQMTKGNWASHLGMSQESLSRKLGQLQEMGLIKLQGQRIIHVLDKEKLAEIE
ncbi:MAG: Crp/Fnr family transcriptional regulator [Bacillota bacterium]